MSSTRSIETVHIGELTGTNNGTVSTVLIEKCPRKVLKAQDKGPILILGGQKGGKEIRMGGASKL